MEVPNKNRKFGSAKTYIHVVIDGKDALLTSEAARVAIERAVNNLEDVPVVVKEPAANPPVGVSKRIIRWFTSLWS